MLRLLLRPVLSVCWRRHLRCVEGRVYNGCWFIYSLTFSTDDDDDDDAEDLGTGRARE